MVELAPPKLLHMKDYYPLESTHLVPAPLRGMSDDSLLSHVVGVIIPS